MSSKFDDEVQQERDVAKGLMENAQSKELYALYLKSLTRLDTVTKALDSLAAHYAGTKDTPMIPPSSDAVQSMERVALAAMELAKAVVSGTTDAKCSAGPSDKES